MKTSSAKAKGRRLQKYLVDKLIEVLEIDPEDLESRPMGSQGEDIILSQKARKAFPFSPECKNQERLNVWGAFEQAESNCGKYEPLLVFSKNRSPVYAMIKLDCLLNLLKKINFEK